MTSLDDRRHGAAIDQLPALPRALFLLHNFYGVDVDAMADALSVDREAMETGLADARAIVRAHVCYADPVPGVGSTTDALQARLQQEYRRALEAAFAESGYPGEVEWPEPMADITADQEAAAAFVVTALSAALRKAVARSRRAGVAAVDQWRFVAPWRRVRRRRLLRVNDALHCAGWQPFNEWLAERLVPDQRYPQGYVVHRRRRRPFPEERPLTEAEQNGEEIADIVQIPERLVEQPELTRHVWIFFHLYGRPYDEIARLLGISRRRVKRLREQAEYAIIGKPYPSLAFHIRFALMRKRLAFAWRWDIIRSAFYG
jgi:DNA-directed RNA polymerase specialized sigma24 family protein